MTNTNFEKYQFLVEQELARYKELITFKWCVFIRRL